MREKDNFVFGSVSVSMMISVIMGILPLGMVHCSHNNNKRILSVVLYYHFLFMLYNFIFGICEYNCVVFMDISECDVLYSTSSLLRFMWSICICLSVCLWTNVLLEMAWKWSVSFMCGVCLLSSCVQYVIKGSFFQINT
jgi:hypothetical protein